MSYQCIPCPVGVVFTSADRLARQMTEQEGVLAEVWRAGGRVFSLGDGGEILEDDPLIRCAPPSARCAVSSPNSNEA
jgi:hypothetical protein